MTAPRCMIFDFDGTLADSFAAILEIANRLAPQYGYRPAQPEELDVLRAGTYRDLSERLGIKMHKIPLIAAHVRRELAKELDHVKPIAGLPDVLEGLSEQGVELGIMSSNNRTNIERFLRQHHITQFGFVSTASNLWGKKSHLKGLLKRRGLTPEHAMYIGDEPRDVDACNAIPLPVTAVTWGFASASRLAKHNPTHLIHDPKELLGLAS